MARSTIHTFDEEYIRRTRFDEIGWFSEAESLWVADLVSCWFVHECISPSFAKDGWTSRVIWRNLKSNYNNENGMSAHYWGKFKNNKEPAVDYLHPW